MTRFLLAIILSLTLTTPCIADDQKLYGAVEQSVTFIDYLRVRAIGMSNPLGNAPVMEMYRERCKVYSDNRPAECRDAGILRVTYDPKYVFPIKDPINGRQIGTGDYQTIYTLIDSLFRAKQAEEDAVAQQPEPQP